MNVPAKIQEATKLIELAGIYIEDGAPITAADRLEKAAVILREVSAHRIAMLDS